MKTYWKTIRFKTKFALHKLQRNPKRVKVVKLFIAALFGFIGLLLLYHVFVLLLIHHSLENIQTLPRSEALKNQTIYAVNQLFELPPGQSVTFAQITDTQMLTKIHTSFSKARKGDYVLSYPDLSIIYDPQIKTIVDIERTNILQ